MGNICRSPTAQGIFEQLVAEAGLDDVVHIDSAGTHAYHVGNQPDERATRAARRRGIDLTTQRARQVSVDDFHSFDYLIAMDHSNRDDLLAGCPQEHRGKIRLLLEAKKKAQLTYQILTMAGFMASSAYWTWLRAGRVVCCTKSRCN